MKKKCKYKFYFHVCQSWTKKSLGCSRTYGRASDDVEIASVGLINDVIYQFAVNQVLAPTSCTQLDTEYYIVEMLGLKEANARTRSFHAISSSPKLLPKSVSITYGNTGKNIFYFFYKIRRRKIKRGNRLLYRRINFHDGVCDGVLATSKLRWRSGNSDITLHYGTVLGDGSFVLVPQNSPKTAPWCNGKWQFRSG